jgi:hypothetical protein
MLKRIWSVTAAAALVTAVCLAGPALAQAPLGLSIDPTEGFPGDVVHAMVNTTDIANNCATTVDQVESAFVDVYLYLNQNETIQIYFPDYPEVDVVPSEDYVQLAYVYLYFTVLGVAFNVEDGAQTALENSHALVFANLAQEVQGEPSTFDQDTGLGSVVVPNVDPGLWVVAAACVAPDISKLDDTLQAMAPILEADGRSLEFFDDQDTFIQYLTDHAVQFLQPFVTPVALGVQPFTVLAHLGHFQCYRAHPTVGVGAGTAGGTIPTSLPVTLEDQFGVYSGTAHRPVDLCAPADKNGEDSEAPDSGDFLSSYKLSVPGPVEHISGVQATNQFGSITLDLLQPDTLLVPSAASLEGPPAPGQSFLNDFTCYSVQVGKTKGKGAPAPGSVMVQTAFETVEVEPGNPQRLCVPASKNGGPVIASAPEDLLCYDVKSGNDLKPAPEVFVANQFGQEAQRIGQRRELCVPTDLTE